MDWLANYVPIITIRYRENTCEKCECTSATKCWKGGDWVYRGEDGQVLPNVELMSTNIDVATKFLLLMCICAYSIVV